MKEFIHDQETDRCVAFILNGEIFRDTKENEKIATVHAGNLYDLNGNLVGHLQGTHIIGRDATMPVSFKKLLGGE